MSINITVNGKFTKQTILDNPECARKELEAKRRTIRLQQVRVQSKELARKIRNDVSKEKEKQLRNLEAVKAQELNCWRKHVLTQKCHDYQKSINEIGQAHKAAREENCAKNIPKTGKTPSPSRIPHIKRNIETKTKSFPNQNKANKTKQNPELVVGKRMQVCFDSKLQNCTCISVSDSEEDEKCDSDCAGSTLSSGSSLDHFEVSETICREVGREDEQPVTLQKDVAKCTEPYLINFPSDKSLETSKIESNTKLSPTKSTACTQTSVDMTPISSKNEATTTTSSEVIETSSQPRYTQISDLIAKQNQGQTHQDETSPIRKKDAIEKSTSSETTSKVTSPKNLSSKSIHSRLQSVPKSSAVTILTAGTYTRMTSGSDSSSKVQYYDYQNKFSREYALPAAVAVPQANRSEPNAMERAYIEKNLQKKREEELTKLRQKSEERGQRALEKEQVRRECVELTEKLEALTHNQQTLLPSDANLHNHQYYALKAARKESKLNGAIEELLSRPAIITCPDVRVEQVEPTEIVDKQKKLPLTNDAGDLNLGATKDRKPAASNENLSSDSSGTILLGYMDDERNSIRKKITQCPSHSVTNHEKVQKFQMLLDRIENLRGSLIKEIDKNELEPEKNEATTIVEQDSKERQNSETIVKRNSKVTGVKDVPKQVSKKKTSEKRESSKERSKVPPAPSMAEIKIVTSNNEIIQHPHPGQPLEIVIKLKTETSAQKGPNLKSEKGKVTKQIRTEFQKSTKIYTSIPAPPPPVPGVTVNRRGSYDSNSTAYRELPAALNDASEQFVKRMTRTNQPYKADITPETTANNESTTQLVDGRAELAPRAHLNPLIAQYIQRLLAMSHKSVSALEVSSTEVESPCSSVINISSNMNNVDTGDSFSISEEHVQRVERFITDNRSFINELEESFRTHSNESLETSLRRLEEAWMQKFHKNGKMQNAKIAPAERIADTKKKTIDKPKVVGKKEKKEKQQQQHTKQRKYDSKSRGLQKNDQRERKNLNLDSRSKQQQQSNVSGGDDAGAELLIKSQTQLQHYAELTKNCSTRIAELTALITKVRAEKQRLMEITLTSGSDNERNSTEYRDLPVELIKNKNDQEPVHAAINDNSSISSNEAFKTSPKQQQSHKEDHQNAALALEKNKKTGHSRDSGISVPSRPVTAMGNENETDPQSFVSSIQTSTTAPTTSSVFKKPHPPPALATQNRYSPLTADDEVVHELSTIVEVDTPATSRLNTSTNAQLIQNRTQQQQLSTNIDTEVLQFPTFDEYVRMNHLDLTTLDHEQSLHMEFEYNELIEILKNGHGTEVINYDAFPTLSAYLQDMTTNDEKFHSPETFDDLFERLRLTPVQVKPFPSHQEYLKRKSTQSPQVEFVESDSIDTAKSGGASGYTGVESDTIDIERELQRRNILKGSFRSLSTRKEVISVSSSGCKNPERSQIAAQSTAIELDINDPEDRTNSSGSDSVSEKFQQELRALGLQWPQSMRKKEKQAAALNSPSSSSDASSNALVTDKAKQVTKSTNNQKAGVNVSDTESSDRPLNLRDFLTRQLLKHAAATSSADTSLSGDSLRSQFFLAVLDSMTPNGTPRANTNTTTTNRNERQKTSTPVPSPTTDGCSISNSTQLFSNESRISTVHQSGSSTRVARDDQSTTKNKSK